MGRHPSKSSQMRYGAPIRTNVAHDVAAALLAEATRSRRTVSYVAATILSWWAEDVAAEEAKRKDLHGT